MSKFRLSVTAGVANVYPYGQGSDVTEVLHEGESLDLVVPVGPHPEPHIATPPLEKAKDMLRLDLDAPAAGVAKDEKYGERDGTLEVECLEGAVKVRVYEGATPTEKPLAVGEATSVEVTESNAITLAVYDAAPQIDPRK